MDMEPVTRQELREELTSLEERMEQRIDTKLGVLSDRLVEQMRDMQTELLRGFNAFAAANTARMDRLELSDMTVVRRMTTIEERLLQIETRLGIPPPGSIA